MRTRDIYTAYIKTIDRFSRGVGGTTHTNIVMPYGNFCKIFVTYLLCFVAIRLHFSSRLEVSITKSKFLRWYNDESKKFT